MAKRDEYPANRSVQARLQAAAEGLADCRGMLDALRRHADELGLPTHIREAIDAVVKRVQRGSDALSGE
jgi:hypothetical protein